VPQFLLPLELEGRQHSVPRVLALRIVEHLDVVEHVPSGFVALAMGPASDPFALEQVEEALSDGIVMAVASTAHGVLEIVGLQESGSVHACELAALIRMDQHFGLRLPAPDRHQQCLQDDVGRLAALHRPADHAA